MKPIIGLVCLITLISSGRADDWCVEITRVTPQIGIRFIDAATAPIPLSHGAEQFSIRLLRTASDRAAWVLDGDTSSPFRRWVVAHIDLSGVDRSIKVITIDGMRHLQALRAHHPQQPERRICAPGRLVSLTGCMSEAEIDELDFVAVEQEVSFDWSALQRNVQYPSVAMRNRIEGTVVVSALICRDGSILDLKIAASDNPVFNEAATSAVRGTTFDPAIQNGAPVTCWVRIPIAFSLRQ